MAKTPALPCVMLYESDRFTVVGIDEGDTTDLCYEVVDKATQSQVFLYGLAAKKFCEVCEYWRDAVTPSQAEVEHTLQAVVASMGTIPLRVH